MTPVTTIPWWMAMLLGVLALPFLVAFAVARLAWELVDGLRRGEPRC